MRAIPQSIKTKLASDPFMKKCCLCGTHGATIKIEWHHNLIFAHRQSNLPETILPLCEPCHSHANNRDVKERLDLIMLNRMSDETIMSISKAVNWSQRKKYLTKKYG